MFSDESETWTSYDDYSSYDDDDEELQSQIELIQEQISQRNRLLILILKSKAINYSHGKNFEIYFRFYYRFTASYFR